MIKQNKQIPKKISTPFGYFGAKNKIATRLCENLPPHNCWVEAFCGSAALTLRKNIAPIEIINDLDDEIINFFEQLRNNYEALAELIDLTPYAEKELINSRNIKKKTNKLERARLFVVQSMMAINGAFGKDKGGFSFSNSYVRNGHEARVNRWNNLPKRLKLVAERLKAVRIVHQDAIKLLKEFSDRPATLMYLDPPYLDNKTFGYKKEAHDPKFHEELLTIACKARCMIFISGYENELYNSFLTPEKGWVQKKIATTTKGINGHSLQRTEVIWMNKYFINAQKFSRLNLKLTAKEIKENKLNPIRKTVSI